jgi:hypothetical protein
MNALIHVFDLYIDLQVYILSVKLQSCLFCVVVVIFICLYDQNSDKACTAQIGRIPKKVVYFCESLFHETETRAGAKLVIEALTNRTRDPSIEYIDADDACSRE